MGRETRLGECSAWSELLWIGHDTCLKMDLREEWTEKHDQKNVQLGVNCCGLNNVDADHPPCKKSGKTAQGDLAAV